MDYFFSLIFKTNKKIYLNMLCISFLCIFVIHIERIQCYLTNNKNEKFPIVQRKFEHDYHEVARRKRQDVRL